MYYQKSVTEVARELSTDINRGLTRKEVGIRLLKFGYNLLPQKPKSPAILKFFNQFKNLLVGVLLLASLVSLFLGDVTDALAIFAIVILNASIGFIQEIKAERTLESLKEKEILYALVLRDGKMEKIPSSEIVIGDILVLEEGEKMAADARLVEEFALQIDESILTGESMPVGKNTEVISRQGLPLADHTNIIYKDTKILAGRGRAIVFATGAKTEIGKIAASLQETIAEKTPLTRELESVAKTLTLVIAVIAGVVFFLNVLDDIPVVESLLVSISLAVAAIPEGLPAIVTIVLSLGVKRLADKKSIVRHLSAVETLGAVKIIATDKTGTLTQNKISVVNVLLSGNLKFTVEGKGYNLAGSFYDFRHKKITPSENDSLISLLTGGVLANNSAIGDEKSKDPKIIGDTTEGALLVAGYRGGLDVDKILKKNTRVFEIPFTSNRKMMSVVVKSNGKYYLYAKGAPEILVNNLKLTNDKKKELLTTNANLEKQGLRSLCLAFREVSETEPQM